MHIIVREARELDEAAAVQDLGLSPADILVLSFSDSDLAMAAAAFRNVPSAERLSLRVVNLSALRHPMSVDLFIDATVKGSKAVLVRLLPGVDANRFVADIARWKHLTALTQPEQENVLARSVIERARRHVRLIRPSTTKVFLRAA